MLLAVALVAVAANPYLDDGRARFAALEFEAAARALAVAMDQPSVSREEAYEGHDLWAQSLLALGRTDEALGVYSRLLRLDPHAPVPQAAPKVVEAFLKARQQVWPRPSVSFNGGWSEDGTTVVVHITDPWSLVKRIRRLEDGPRGLVERESPRVENRAFTVTPGADATRLLLDALDAAGVLLAHLELPVSRPAAPPVPVVTAEPTSPRPRWMPVLLGAAAVVAAGLAATFLYLGFRPAPRLDRADEINDWNGAASRNAATGWSLTGAAGLFAVAAVIFGLR